MTTPQFTEAFTLTSCNGEPITVGAEISITAERPFTIVMGEDDGDEPAPSSDLTIDEAWAFANRLLALISKVQAARGKGGQAEEGDK